MSRAERLARALASEYGLEVVVGSKHYKLVSETGVLVAIVARSLAGRGRHEANLRSQLRRWQRRAS